MRKDVQLVSNIQTGPNQSRTQTIRIISPIKGHDFTLNGTVFASSEAFANQSARIPGAFEFIRNEVGPSHNLLNNAVYDRYRDWLLSGPLTQTRIVPINLGRVNSKWSFSATGKGEIELQFRPAMYRRHKNIRYFQPWKYQPWRKSITGWCSWWAYRDAITEQDVRKIDVVFDKDLKNYGYKYIQIDDGYESGLSGTLKDWLTTNSKFPDGLSGLEKEIANHGLEPGIWINVHFNDPETLKEHPNWFIQDAEEHPHKGPWIEYALNPASRGAVQNIILPHLTALKKQGWKYVKIDTLRHFLYDSMYPSRSFLRTQGETPEHLLRLYMRIARQTLGTKTYILSCWGVLPEVVGYANGCRLGTDGFGPSTLQQYSSWNNVVWKNDPDHCDLAPFNSKTKTYDMSEARLRGTLVAMAGAQLLLSDHPNIYENPEVLGAARRVSPILFTQPGQIYDFDPIKTNNLIKNLRNQDGGSNPGPIDADQFGKVCPWWALDINESWERWLVLSRMNWTTEAMSSEAVSFSSLGLNAKDRYLVYEGWNQKFLGLFSGSFSAPELAPKHVDSFAIRKFLGHPQLLSTNRNISQGAVAIKNWAWNSSKGELNCEAKVLKGENLQIVLYVPSGFHPQGLIISTKDRANEVVARLHESAKMASGSQILTVSLSVPENRVVNFRIKFSG